MATPSPVYLFKHVKHGTQNIQNDCHQWLSDSCRLQQLCFRPGLSSGPRWRSLRAPPNSLAVLRGPTSKGEGKGKRKEEKGKREGEGPDPLSQIPGSAPVGAPLSAPCVMIYDY